MKAEIATPVRTDIPAEPRGASRRAVVLGAGAAIAAWSIASGWLTVEQAAAADGTTTGMQPVPPLDGRLELSDVGDFDHDFGGFITRAPWAVLRAGSTGDIVKMIEYAGRNGLRIAVNGQSGEPGLLESHSNYGQGLTEGGIQIDARSFATIETIEPTRAVVGAGATWAEVVEAALKIGATVPTLPDYLRLSVGGTVSVGGIGGNVQRVGLSADIVRSLELVTGRGEVVTASRQRYTELFDAARAGGGQVGVITKVELDLVPAESTATIRTYYYTDLKRFVADQETVMAAVRFDHHSGSIVRTPDNTGWRFAMELGSYHSTPEAAGVDDLEAGLGDIASDRDRFSKPYRDWAFRLDPLVPELIKGGYWQQRKPWLSLLIPSDAVETFVGELLPELTPADLGAGFCLLSPLDPGKITAPMFAVPRGGDGLAFFFDLLAFPEPAEQGIDAMLERNRRLYDRLVELGGKRYIIGAIPRMTTADWRRHFGPENYAQFSTLKHQHDPNRVLTPGQGFFE
ncbi:FAD-binding protein [Rathayibacter rathayi]|uniref:FAD-binding protein n=1 Tax=Rathayibacter rathayi TaxID=33887 RepID=A0ABX5AAM9_RATRA|nr:FAD-binding protein [Rathayibacter rathayi]MWV75813.1 FAD-binding protein [Rathayibacter rathayi NCPPB 2980 = VKM Ac-1601]PPF21429.1 FAD-binding protein [Rathayibacter rathayi]PPF45723.1 FAD-binding protein [Rathayibacter rathayi]PPF78294.1 FAD-binding protein [Rathayibacter rathayi]PPG11684.1 FAD-binding protein [Rathayibacter rathayi]